MPSRQFGAALFGIALASLAVGLACRFAGEPGRADLALAAGTSVVLIALCVEIARSLAQGRFGLDIIAAFSMAGCLAAGEMLAGCVVALMFSGGQLLEGFAQGRAEREMTALLSRQATASSSGPGRWCPSTGGSWTPRRCSTRAR